jgi:hypothetical protein
MSLIRKQALFQRDRTDPEAASGNSSNLTQTNDPVTTSAHCHSRITFPLDTGAGLVAANDVALMAGVAVASGVAAAARVPAVPRGSNGGGRWIDCLQEW